jgi:acetyl esterase/lipase
MRRTLPILALLTLVLVSGCGIPVGHLNTLFDAYRTGVWYLRESPLVTLDVPYGDDPMQKIDVYRTAAKTPAPVVVFIHGGAWQYGDRKQLAAMGKVLADRGYVVFMPDYRMYPKVTYPAFVDDTVLALNWIMAHAAQYGGDPARVVVCGHSAGAHLTMIPFTDETFRKKLAFDPMAIRGLAPISGPFVFADVGDRAASQKDLHNVMGGDEGYRKSEPIGYPRADLPPVLVMVGDKDDLTPLPQAERYAAALKAAGADVRFENIVGTDHITILLPLVDAEPGRAGDVLFGFFASATHVCQCGGTCKEEGKPCERKCEHKGAEVQ